MRAKLLEIWQVMRECVAAGIATEGVLPGGLKVRRRAPALARALRAEGSRELHAGEWLTLWAMAVNEENAAGRTGGDRPHQRRGRHHPGRAALLRRVRSRGR